jgi:tetratricopeptide (TPR) repeat protein
MNGFTYPVPKPSKGFDGNIYQLVDGNLYQMRGEYALELHSYDQAILDFSKVIEENPSHPDAYLDRATAYLNSGDYERSLRDYQSYTAQKPAPLKYAYDFSAGFAKGLPKGVIESGVQLGSFARDAIIHPINTATEVAQALSSLSKLVYSQESETLAEALAPEVCELLTKWDTFSPKEQGYHGGYIFGKYGADILIPGASAKVLSKGAKGAKKLATACKSLKNAEKTLPLESLAQGTFAIGEDAGIAKREMTHLSQGEILHASITKPLGNIGNNPTMLESIQRFDYAKEFLKPYSGKFMPENQVRELIQQAGIPTFPRPKGTPENFRVKLSEKPGGMKYIHPEHTHESIRVMPGKPHSPNPHQQKPYVVHMRDGKALDKYGYPVIDISAPEAHIPLEEFVYRKK